MQQAQTMFRTHTKNTKQGCTHDSTVQGMLTYADGLVTHDIMTHLTSSLLWVRALAHASFKQYKMSHAKCMV